MDYEKKYKEALERAKQFSDNPYLEDSGNVVEYIFPELEESEERIRKVLVDYFNRYKEQEQCGIKTFYGIPTDNILAWLEKQGDKDKLIQELGEYKVKYTQEVLSQQLEKQEEPNPYSGTSFKYDGHVWGMCARDNGVEIIFNGELKAFLSLEKSFIYPISSQKSLAPKSAMEAIKKEKVDNQNCVKLADNIEPKFKVGDWISNGRHTKLIVGINSDWLYYMLNDGTSERIRNIDEKYHLWTIQDAKAGDVLETEGFVFIFKNIREDKGIGYFCANEKELHEGDDSTFHIANPNSLMGSINNGFTHYSPATKEQRDLLFQKMKEAGYECDAEKKELKKVSQRMISAEAKEVLYDKPAWSEEDEKTLNTTISFLSEYAAKGYENAVMCIDWLKSLKEKMKGE